MESSVDQDKTVYFIRHGQTRQNELGVHQYPEDQLTENGREQARRAMGALVNKGIELVIASDLARASETGSIIAKGLGVPLEYTALAREVRRPTFLWGKKHTGMASLAFFTRYFLTGVVGNHRIDNEETMREFEERIGHMLDMLAARPQKSIAVATHRGVMSVLGATVRGHGHASGIALLIAFLGMYAVDNGEITVATYTDGRWHLDAQNLHAHLHHG